jgi:hypothetical protein
MIHAAFAGGIIHMLPATIHRSRRGGPSHVIRRNIIPMAATITRDSLLHSRFSYSRTHRRFNISHPNVRSTTHRLWIGT